MQIFSLIISQEQQSQKDREKKAKFTIGYDTKQSDGGEVPVMLEIWEMWSTLSLPSLPGPLWPSMVALNRVLSMGQIELNCVLMLN